MRLVLFADLHLDATFSWAPADVARRRRANLRRTLERIVALADEVGADAILSAGDLYEHEHVTTDTARFLVRTLGGAARPVILAPGNHDPLAAGSLYASATWPDNVTLVTASQLAPIDLEPGFRLWAAAHHVVAGTPGFLDGFAVEGNAVHYALFHGSERSGLQWEGRKDPHAPFDASQVPAVGLAHALVGHFHTPRLGTWHTYPGNPDPLTFGEEGERGAVVVDVADDGTARRTSHHVAVSVVADVVVDVTGAGDRGEILARVREVVGDADGEVRVTLQGELAEDVDLRLEDVTALGTTGRTVVARIGRLDVAYDLAALATEPTVRGRFVRAVQGDDTLDEDRRRRVLVAGLRALAGRDDLEVA